ncbi:Fe-S cluster assembly protein SufD [Siccirubricoccus sp. KC 17139]|uniref:Fe-S cluster assembly protein SufD n=1 Tax=Siccirubricoccus soli TaxID=2899147 RepID=A0ABT1D0Z8_9PROT|nr:Fe-S cluster assembly protein SufD [Siccirubricoccus soli]MCO6415578.1 Fe-S cluster assembly protein SufD [Siccirubricoccus soli]MCP2681710.1 Fe-S cluster assembly protein SufD [Siccirubricoccus soli]
MSAIATGAEGFLHRFDGLRQRLPGARLAWVQALREAAAESFRAQGFPTRRLEAWKYTDLRLVADAGFEEALSVVDAEFALPPAHSRWRAVFQDGRLREDLSTLEEAPFAAASLAAGLSTLEGRLGALARPAEQALVALNTALFEDGLVVTVPAGVAGGVLELVSLASPGERPAAFHPRHLIRLEAGASLTLIETATGPAGTRYLHNPVYEIELAEGATLTHARLQQEGSAAFQLGTAYARVAAGATYDNFTLNAGGKLVRNEIHVVLEGPKAACHMNGAQLLRDGQHADTTTVLDHAAPDCASRQTYKTVLSGRSRGVFQGKIHVHQVAQRTDGYQMNQALLLSPEAEIDSKPQLEIYADDVKCSHGATVGEIDADQLFYLRARGIPEAQARSMLVEAFLTEAVEGVQDAVAREALQAAVTGWWEKAA